MKCKACGGDSMIDMSQERHARLNNYIIKHPPEPKISKAEKKCVVCFWWADILCMHHPPSQAGQGGA